MAIFIFTLQYTINVNIIKVHCTILVDTFFLIFLLWTLTHYFLSNFIWNSLFCKINYDNNKSVIINVWHFWQYNIVLHYCVSSLIVGRSKKHKCQPKTDTLEYKSLVYDYYSFYGIKNQKMHKKIHPMQIVVLKLVLRKLKRNLFLKVQVLLLR